MILIFLATAALFAEGATSAPPAAPPPASGRGLSGVTVTGAQAKHRALDPKEIVCHREPVMGSLFPKEVCARREEFADRQRTDQAETRRTQALGQLEVLNKADTR